MAGAENQSGADNGDQDMETIRRRLDTLDGKLAAAKGLRQLPEDPEGRGKAMGYALKLGVEMVAGVAVGGFIGWALDQLFDTKPIFMLVFLVLGAASGIMNVIRTAHIAQGEPMPGHHLRVEKAQQDKAKRNEDEGL